MPCPQYMCIYMQREASCFLLLFNPMTLIPSGGPHLRVQCAMLSCFSCVQIFAISWTVACQAPLSMRCSRQESWSGLPCPPPGIYQSSMFQISKYKSSNTENKITFCTLPLPKSARVPSCVYMSSAFFAHTQSERRVL